MPASQTTQARSPGEREDSWTLPPPLPADVSRLCRAGVQTEQQLQREEGEHVQIPCLPASAQPGGHSR